MPSAVASGHSHRPTTKVSHKPFKSRKATKGALREAAKGKLPNERGQRKTPHQQVMSKLDRRNQAKQRQLEKHHFVILVLSAEVEVDDLGELILRSVEGQGMSTLFTVVQRLSSIEPVKQRSSVLGSLKSYMMHFHPEQDKMYSVDSRQECSNLVRSLCNIIPKGVRWRDERSWMLVEDIQFPGSAAEAAVLTGVIRGKGLNADRLVQVGDWGTFQIEKIYQSAWYLDDDISDSGSDAEDFDMQDAEEGPAQPEDGMEGHVGDTQTEAGPSEYQRSEAFMELDETEDAEQLAAYRAKKRDEAEDDLEFPDEIELHPNVSARERLARYRGLKSLRTSPWLEDEDRAHEPENWQRLLHISDYKSSRSKAAREALVGGVASGTRVHVHLNAVPKRTVLNFLVNLSSDHSTPIKSKEELIMQCGPRRFIIYPLFSQGGSTPNDVHKYCRYLHPGQSAVATFLGPVTWGSVPALFFKRTIPESGAAENDGEAPHLPLTLVATGTALPPSTSRVVAKRAILTGHPYHIHKKLVTIRYMFFNRKDVEWFKALPLWTKRGRGGYIKEALGTHGYFKATFDGRVNPQDTIGVSLYKRVWPRISSTLSGPLLDVSEGSRKDETQDAMNT
ncbi:hypothetical protein P8C59_006221 [Phyllachora maydis]|uniref:Bms1-type G domain-containing protein n=1 Tax=Phyllachora maydis TaxID=1825666 RepID=A0AAD9I630_9PEZI|nr:hypothetical protein P8C59_006221 [Phyllachora maydis]